MPWCMLCRELELGGFQELHDLLVHIDTLKLAGLKLKLP